jgi:uncharacterized protein (DUF2062 family)
MMDRDKVLESRWLRPFAHLFGHPALWTLSRRSVPRALAVGLFAAFILPVGQFLLAALLAMTIRGNVPLAAAATLVTNPLTFGPIYFAAYETGNWVLRFRSTADAGKIASGYAQQVLQVTGPTALGLVIFSVAASLGGYAIGALWWRSKLVQRRQRKQRHATDSTAG